MNKALIYSILVIISVLAIQSLLNNLDIYSSSLLFNNLLQLSEFLILLVPILLLILVKNKKIRYIGLSIYGLILMVLWFPIMFIGIFAINDIKINNGFRKIYEQQLGENEFFSIYRTPDAGAFGGDDQIFTIDNKLTLGFIKRRRLHANEYQRIQNFELGTNIVVYKSDTITFTNEELRGKGELK